MTKKKETTIILPTNITEVHAIQCNECLTIIYSCAGHDFRSCSCGACFIDGGFDYCRIGGEPAKMHNITILVPASKKELYDDWNQSNQKLRKFGCVKLIS